MKNLALAFALAAVFAAPAPGLADPQGGAAALPAGSYFIVDAQTGRTIGKLVALSGPEAGLRTFGTTTAATINSAKAQQPLFPHMQTIGGPSDDLLTGYHAQFGDTSP